MLPVEVWGGVECTVARVGDTYIDQIRLTGHEDRIEDLERVAALGITRIRYPVLWERVAPDGLDKADWRWTDERLARLRDLGLRPIVGLVHHGSGPRGTSLADPGFAEGLAAFAARVAERYPWVDAYTPVNEPLTTARFSGLYGHWYPHGRDMAGFLRMLVNEIRATHLAMTAIRAANPSAMLIQTEDLGKTHSTPRLAYQAEHENQRRWLSLDLLTARVDDSHPFRRWFEQAGLGQEIDALQAVCRPPDIVGINHYLTSERFLDEHLERYPVSVQGGNGRHRYADVEAVRAMPEGPDGPERLLRETWKRYRLPLAVTEVHNGSTREEQLRWLAEIWEAAGRLRSQGTDIRAVTVWALLGSYEWNSLLTQRNGYYEPGAFDLRAPQPRATAIAQAIRKLATGAVDGCALNHPVLDVPGWWRREDRLFPWHATSMKRTRPVQGNLRHNAPRPLLITGANGTLGRAFKRICALRGLACHVLSRDAFDIADPISVRAGLARYRPWAVINTAGFVRVDDAEDAQALCRRENAHGPAVLAATCAEAGVPLVSFSSDLVFDGRKRRPYVESDPVSPLNIYGATKAEAENTIAATHAGALVVRTSAFFGPWDEYNFVTLTLRRLAAGEPMVAANDVTVSPTYVPDLVHTTLDLLIDGETGIWHVANRGAVTWADLAREAAVGARLDPALVQGLPLAELGWRAPRPRYTVLDSARGSVMPTLDRALGSYFDARAAVGWGEPAGGASAAVPMPAVSAPGTGRL
jgi:dTDP-4-dehydrorhamnose reductase